MKALIGGLILALSSISLVAQKSPIKFGNIPMEDMKMTSYDLDSSAAAVVLCDYGEAYLQVTSLNASLNFERHIRIKILKKEGLSWADVAIPLYHSGNTEEKLNGLKAVAYNLEGGKIAESKMSKDGIFKEKTNRNINTQKFTIPNVKEGTVIEYSYTISSEFVTNFPHWQFQYTIPVRWSEYWAIIPEFFVYEKYMQGYLQVKTYEVKTKAGTDFQSEAHHWIVQNAPAFKEEPYMTSDDDYLSRINFALSYTKFPNQPIKEIMGSWQKLNDNLLDDEDFGGIIKTSGFLKRQVEEITAGMTDPMQKLTAIYNYVKNTLEWDGARDFYGTNPKKIFEDKKGSSGDINIILASMLEKADISADMVLVSTRDHGFIRKEYPMRKQFNYAICIARVGDKSFLLDATEKLLTMNTLPARCLNGEGLVISKTNHGWVKLDTKTKARTVISADFALNNTGEMKGKLGFSREGYDAHTMRKRYQSKGEEEYLKEFLGDKSWQVDRSEFQNVKEIDQSAKETHELTISQHASVAGDVMYINPFIISQMAENPFKLEKREYPVDFGSQVEEMYMCKLIIPEGFAVDEAPKSKVMMLPGNTAKYAYSCAVNGNLLTIVSNLQINRSLFAQDEYANLREFYNQVVAKQAEQIVLKKK